MSIRLFTDSSANLPEELLREQHIQVLSLTLRINEEEHCCYEPGKAFDGNAFYARMREDSQLAMSTSMVNTEAFLRAFTPALEAGEDVLYVAMSSGISGTCSAGQVAAAVLQETYPQRRVLVVDTLAASLGEGLQVLEAAALRDRGCSAEEIAGYLEGRRSQICQYFMVEDLMYLRRGGRISKAAALAGAIMSIRPILKGDRDGRIVLDRKVIGRRKAIAALGEMLELYLLDTPENCRVGIAHGGCEADAMALADAITQKHPGLAVTVVCYEPGTGAHVGPGTVALFFWGGEPEAERKPLLPSIKAKLMAEAESIRAGIGSRLHKPEAGRKD